MRVSRILVPVRGDGKGENSLDHAMVLAGRYSSHVQVLNAVPLAEDMMPFGVVVPSVIKEQIADAAKHVAEVEQSRLKALFDDYATRHGLTMVDELPTADGGKTVSWRQETGKQAEWISRHGRLADLIVVAQPDRGTNLGFNTLQSALMNSGRPVMMCPDKSPPDDLGANIALAWNGSTEAARAVSLTLPILADAAKITVLCVDAGSDDIEIPGEELVSYLGQHGISAGLKTLKSKYDTVTRTLLDGAGDAGCSMMVSGAFGQSRGHDLIFGGVTQRLINRADLPVIFVH